MATETVEIASNLVESKPSDSQSNENTLTILGLTYVFHRIANGVDAQLQLETESFGDFSSDLEGVREDEEGESSDWETGSPSPSSSDSSDWESDWGSEHTESESEFESESESESKDPDDISVCEEFHEFHNIPSYQDACNVCLDEPKRFAFLPCGHACACEECGQDMTRCPICRSKVRKRIFSEYFACGACATGSNLVYRDCGGELYPCENCNKIFCVDCDIDENTCEGESVKLFIT